MMEEKLQPHLSSAHIEVQERASTALVIIRLVSGDEASQPPTTVLADLAIVTMDDNAMDGEADREEVKEPPKCSRLLKELQELFSGELNPVAPKAQRKVPIPEG